MPDPPTTMVLNGTASILDFFRQNQLPIFYVSSGPFNMLGAEEWIGNLSFIACWDSFGGRHPRVFPVAPPPGNAPTSIEAANNYLLDHPAVAAHVRGSGPGAGVLFLMFDEHTEALARARNLTVALPPARLRRHLDSKVTTTRLAGAAGVSSVPNVLAPVDSYRALREVARGLGADLVVQLPHGDSGATTFFISTEADYRPHAAAIASHPEVKIMRRIRCRQTTIEGCVTRNGTLAGPLMTEMVGFPELTPFPGGWCGNEVFVPGDSGLSLDIRRQAQRIVVAMGEQLRRVGYWGCFGLDLLLDQDSATLYLGEMNPRITGATPLTNQAALAAHLPPLVLFHLLEWLGAGFSFDIEEFNRHWVETGPAADWSQLIIEHLGPEPEVLETVPSSGVWRLCEDGGLQFSREAFDPGAAQADEEAFLLTTIDAGHTASRGSSIGRLRLRGRLMDGDYRLTERATAWIRGVRDLYRSSTLNRMR